MQVNTPSERLSKRYRLHGKLGAGGMGAVFRATDRVTGQSVALKRVTTAPYQLQFGSRQEAGTDLRVALAQEFQTLASLRHPNIINVIDYGFDVDGQPYYTMDLLDHAQSILNAAQNQPPIVPIRLLVQVLYALVYLHRRGIIHRDLKPSNVLVTNGQAKVLDFGLAVAREQASGFVGTLAYMAPEVVKGEPHSEASDLYAVGVIAYEIFAGHHPFKIKTDLNHLIADICNVPPDLSHITLDPRQRTQLDQADIPTANAKTFQIASPQTITLSALPTGEAVESSPEPPLQALDNPLALIIGKLLRKKPMERYVNAGEVIEALNQVSDQPLMLETQETRESFLQAAKFVGRDAELKQLSDALRRALAGKGSAWLVGGESGIGKTRLLEELRARAMVQGAFVLRGQAVSEGGIPYVIWREPVRNLALSLDLTDSDAGIIKTLVPDIEALLERAIPEPPLLDPPQAQERLLGTIASLFHHLTQPVLLILEDLHWAAESLIVLKRLVAITNELPLLIVGSYRDDERPNLPAELPGMRVLTLERLNTESTTRLAESMLGIAARQPEVVALLQRETEGNAFFLVEVARVLAEEAGQISEIGRRTLPDRVFAGGVQRVVQRRLDRLPPDARPLLRVAAALGRQLDLVVLRTVESRINLDQWLTICANAAILSVQDGQWRFAHDKFRDGVLDTLSAKERRAVHRQVAIALESVYPESPDRASVLAYHWQLAGDDTKERHYAALAGKRAAELSAYSEAQHFLERALLMSTQDQAADTRRQQAVLKFQIGDVYENLGDYPAANRFYAESLALAREIGDPSAIADALRGAAVVAFHLGKGDEAIRQFEESLTLYRQIGDWRGQGLALNGLGRTYVSVLGQVAPPVNYHQQALEAFRKIKDQRGEANALSQLGLLAQSLGQINEALSYYDQALGIHIALSDRASESKTLSNLGITYATMARIPEAISYWEKARAIQNTIGKRSDESVSLSNLASAYTNMARYDQAISTFQQALAMFRSLGEPVGEAFNLLNLGYTYAAVDQFDLAIETLRQGIERAESINNDEFVNWGQSYLARIYLHLNQLPQALERILAARKYDNPENHLNVINIYGLILARMGNKAEAQTAFREALSEAADLLAKTPGFYPAFCARGLASSGLAVLTSGQEQTTLLAQAQETYREVRRIDEGPGNTAAELRLLEELQPLDPEKVLGPVCRILAPAEK